MEFNVNMLIRIKRNYQYTKLQNKHIIVGFLAENLKKRIKIIYSIYCKDKIVYQL